MRLGNILLQQGGVVETGRRVKFQIRQKNKDGATRKWCAAVILPISEDERAGAIAEARAACAASPEADEDKERTLHLVQRFLHNPDNLAEKFVEAKDLPKLRAGLVLPQLQFLMEQYDRHIEAEYPELQPPSTREELQGRIVVLQAQLQAMAEQAAGE